MTRRRSRPRTELTKDWTFDEVDTLRNAVPVEGLKADFRGRPLLRYRPRGRRHFARRPEDRAARLNGDGQDESVFLAPLEEVLAKKATLADDLLMLYHGRWNGSVEPVFEEYQY